MAKLNDDFLSRLREVDYTEEDLVEAYRQEIDEEVIAATIEKMIDLPRETVNKFTARKETKEVVREEIAKFEALQKVYKSSIDHYRKTEVSTQGETLCVLFSDWHFGKVVKDHSGKILFDSNIAFERVANGFAPQLVDIVKRGGLTHKIEDVRFFFLGDLVDNDIIYNTQRLHIDKPVASQFHDVIRAIMLLIGATRAAFQEIGIKNIPIKMDFAPGNHGRAGEDSDSGECSWDTAVASAIDLAITYGSIPNVSVEFTKDKYKVVNVRGHKGLLRHSAPAHAETSAAKAKLGGWNELFDYDFICYGHVHHWGINTYNGKPLFRNGALCGTDDYAIEMAAGDEWGQLVFGVSKDEIPTFIHRLR